MPTYKVECIDSEGEDHRHTVNALDEVDAAMTLLCLDLRAVSVEPSQSTEADLDGSEVLSELQEKNARTPALLRELTEIRLRVDSEGESAFQELLVFLRNVQKERHLYAPQVVRSMERHLRIHEEAGSLQAMRDMSGSEVESWERTLPNALHVAAGHLDGDFGGLLLKPQRGIMFFAIEKTGSVPQLLCPWPEVASVRWTGLFRKRLVITSSSAQRWIFKPEPDKCLPGQIKLLKSNWLQRIINREKSEMAC